MPAAVQATDELLRRGYEDAQRDLIARQYAEHQGGRGAGYDANKAAESALYREHHEGRSMGEQAARGRNAMLADQGPGLTIYRGGYQPQRIGIQVPTPTGGSPAIGVQGDPMLLGLTGQRNQALQKIASMNPASEDAAYHYDLNRQLAQDATQGTAQYLHGRGSVLQGEAAMPQAEAQMAHAKAQQSLADVERQKLDPKYLRQSLRGNMLVQNPGLRDEPGFADLIGDQPSPAKVAASSLSLAPGVALPTSLDEALIKREQLGLGPMSPEEQAAIRSQYPSEFTHRENGETDGLLEWLASQLPTRWLGPAGLSLQMPRAQKSERFSRQLGVRRPQAVKAGVKTKDKQTPAQGGD